MKFNIILICFLIFVYFVFPQNGYVWDGPALGHFTYSFCHANIFHLLGNCFAIWMLNHKIGGFAFLVAVISSYLPTFTAEPTLGASGIIFAHVGCLFGMAGSFKEMCKKILPITILCGLLPHVNMLIHVYCLFIGYVITLYWNKFYAKYSKKYCPQ